MMINIFFTTQVEGEQKHRDSFESNITDSRNTEPIKIEQDGMFNMSLNHPK